MYSGLLGWVPQAGGESKVAISDALTVISLFVAGVWSAQECKNKFESLLERGLTAEESADLIAIAGFVNGGTGQEGKMARLSRVKNGLEAIERDFGLTEAEVRQLMGI